MKLLCSNNKIRAFWCPSPLKNASLHSVQESKLIIQNLTTLLLLSQQIAAASIAACRSTLRLQSRIDTHYDDTASSGYDPLERGKSNAIVNRCATRCDACFCYKPQHYRNDSGPYILVTSSSITNTLG